MWLRLTERIGFRCGIDQPAERASMPLRQSPARFLIIVIALSVSAMPAAALAAAEALERVLALPEAALLVRSSGGQLGIAYQADRAMIPASTIKLVTALAAVERWGLDHRFATNFYLSADDRLWIEGAGDPFLVSEELDLVVVALEHAGVSAVSGVGVDGDLYASGLDIPGRSQSLNPYDAPITALGVNFNTVYLRVQGGRVVSAEEQTPLTPAAAELGRRLGEGTHRVNLGEPALALRYAGELLSAKLAAAGIATSDDVQVGALPRQARRVLTYRSSHDLRDVLTAMLGHSSNFIANQLFLLLAADAARGPVDLLLAQRVMSDWVGRRFGWRGARIEDGAGLSRGNRITARQLVDVVEALAPYRGLLPMQRGNDAVRAKTGTLRGVSAYAGFVRRSGDWAPFALLINQSVEPTLRTQIATELTRAADTRRLCAGGPC